MGDLPDVPRGVFWGFWRSAEGASNALTSEHPLASRANTYVKLALPTLPCEQVTPEHHLGEDPFVTRKPRGSSEADMVTV